MITMTANEAKTRFGEFLDQAQREPVRVMRHDRVVGVMVSAQDYVYRHGLSGHGFATQAAICKAKA
jgi:PHD/YefM family antitoxin component YafN of YafNO toxin-antitoxin module